MKAPLVLLKMDVLIILYKTCDICFYLFALNKVGFLLQDYDVSELLRVINKLFKCTQYRQLHGIWIFQIAIHVSNACR